MSKSLINIIINSRIIEFNKKLIKFFKSKDIKYNLGRWCHIKIPTCNNDVIMRKIDFANNDNNLSNTNLRK